MECTKIEAGLNLMPKSIQRFFFVKGLRVSGAEPLTPRMAEFKGHAIQMVGAGSRFGLGRVGMGGTIWGHVIPTCGSSFPSPQCALPFFGQINVDVFFPCAARPPLSVTGAGQCRRHRHRCRSQGMAPGTATGCPRPPMGWNLHETRAFFLAEPDSFGDAQLMVQGLTSSIWPSPMDGFASGGLSGMKSKNLS